MNTFLFRMFAGSVKLGLGSCGLHRPDVTASFDVTETRHVALPIEHTSFKVARRPSLANFSVITGRCWLSSVGLVLQCNANCRLCAHARFVCKQTSDHSMTVHTGWTKARPLSLAQSSQVCPTGCTQFLRHPHPPQSQRSAVLCLRGNLAAT